MPSGFFAGEPAEKNCCCSCRLDLCPLRTPTRVPAAWAPCDLTKRRDHTRTHRARSPHAPPQKIWERWWQYTNDSPTSSSPLPRAGSKVLERRDADIGGAWTRFVGAATEYSAGRRQRSDARRAHPYPASRDKRAAASEIHDEKLMRLMERYGAESYLVHLCYTYRGHRICTPCLRQHEGGLAAVHP